MYSWEDEVEAEFFFRFLQKFPEEILYVIEEST